MPAHLPYHIPERHDSTETFPGSASPDNSFLSASRRAEKDKTARNFPDRKVRDRDSAVNIAPKPALSTEYQRGFAADNISPPNDTHVPEKFQLLPASAVTYRPDG